MKRSKDSNLADIMGRIERLEERFPTHWHTADEAGPIENTVHWQGKPAQGYPGRCEEYLDMERDSYQCEERAEHHPKTAHRFRLAHTGGLVQQEVHFWKAAYPIDTASHG